MLLHATSSPIAGLSRQKYFLFMRENLKQDISMLLFPDALYKKRQWQRYLSFPTTQSCHHYSAAAHSLFQGLLIINLQPVPQFSSWSLKNYVSANPHSLQVMVSDTVISIFLLSSCLPFLRAWEATSSSCCITLFVPPLPLFHSLPPCTLTTCLPVSTSASTSSSVATLHWPEYFLTPQKPHIHPTLLLLDYFQSLQWASTPMQPLTIQRSHLPADRDSRIQDCFPRSDSYLVKSSSYFSTV